MGRKGVPAVSEGEWVINDKKAIKKIFDKS